MLLGFQLRIAFLILGLGGLMLILGGVDLGCLFFTLLIVLVSVMYIDVVCFGLIVCYCVMVYLLFGVTVDCVVDCVVFCVVVAC